MFKSGSVQHAIRRRSTALAAIIALVTALVPALLLATAQHAAAAGSQQVNFTLEGCRNDGSITLPNGSNKFVCPNSAYTTGNLGKGWNELDLVPFRVTLAAGSSAPSTQTYTFALAVDMSKSGVPGYDDLSVPVLNTALSSPSCQAPSVGAKQTSGTTTQTLYRLVTVTQLAGSTCVYDYYARLALGSHLYSGSSLHANLLNETLGTSGVGSKDVSIPVKEIAPQQLSKDMSATQGSDHVWDVTKSSTPAHLDFSNTCDPNSLSASVSVTVTWTKQSATPGDITVITHVYATNPAARTITVNVSDDIRSGTTVLDSVSSGAIDLLPNTRTLVLSHTMTVPAGTTDLNDVATGSYTDKVTGIVIPGTTTATASAVVQQSGSGNDTATISDVESITGTGLTFSADSFSPSGSGSFDGGYVAGTHTRGPVSWTSNSQNSSGSVTFAKTVYATAATVDAGGGLSDTATLTGSDGFSTHADLTVDIATDAATSLTVTKDSTLALASQATYTFDLYDGTTDLATGDTTTVTLPAGSVGPVTSDPITGLSPTGTYYVKEHASAPFAAQTSSSVTFSLAAGDTATCSANLSVTNSADPAHARVQKITAPTSSGNWTFTLTGPNGLSEELDSVVANAGYVSFASSLEVDGATYTITETPQAGYDLTAVTGDIGGSAPRVSTSTSAKTCSFTLDLTADSDKTLSCTFTNTARGALKVHKTVVKNDAGNTLTDTFSICITGPSYASPTTANGGCQSVGVSGGDLTWSNLLAGDYIVSEVNPGTPWIVGIAPVTVTVAPGATATTALSTVTNTRKGRVGVIKTVSNHDGSGTAAPSGTDSYQFQLRQGATAIIGNPGTVLETLSASAGNGGTITFTTLLTPGQHYQLCETLPAVGWSNTLPNQFVPEQYLADGVTLNPGVINNVECSDFVASAGPDPVVFHVDNRRPPGGNGLTIGYWKNWASCTKSALKSKNALDQTLYLFGANGLVVSATSGGFPVFGPTYYLRLVGGANANAATDCAKAVALLNKSTFSGKKMASDPAYNLAAQLIAAELNYAAGAATKVTTTINQAVLLLGKYHFTGSGHTTITAADAALMNSLAHTLDLYNNNLI